MRGLNRLRKSLEDGTKILKSIPQGALPKNSDFLGKVLTFGVLDLGRLCKGDCMVTSGLPTIQE